MGRRGRNATNTSAPTEMSESSIAATVSHAPIRSIGGSSGAGIRDVFVENLDVAYPGHAVCENATLRLHYGRRYGFVGLNGVGKSTLMNAIGVGAIALPEQIDFFHLKNEVESCSTSALEFVLQADTERERLEAELEDLVDVNSDDEEIDDRMNEIYNRLDELDACCAETRAARILNGLGFNPKMQAAPSSSFSGGWRMRIALAQALFINPTLLLLDEPTNHLDVEAVVWLENYLKRFNKILLMVSHSQDFLNEVCSNIVLLQHGRLNYFDGNYDQYVITRMEKESHQTKRFQWEQNQIKSMKEYIARFGHGHRKLARQAQSKEKTLAKLERQGLEQAVVLDRKSSFYFPCAGHLPPPLIQFSDVSFSYPGKESLFEGLELGLDMDSRICLVGPNGAGKTTLTKLMTRELESTSGYVAKNGHSIIARFHQHFADQIDLDLSPLRWMSSEYPSIINPSVLRGALGRFGISGHFQSTPMRLLSDGQKSRVVLAWMAFKEPHVMILDEPTNHLDMESIDGLADAINAFEGAVVVVSHDLRLLAQIAEEIWICDKGHVVRFDGDIADYKAYVQEQVRQIDKMYQ